MQLYKGNVKMTKSFTITILDEIAQRLDWSESDDFWCNIDFDAVLPDTIISVGRCIRSGEEAKMVIDGLRD